MSGLLNTDAVLFSLSSGSSLFRQIRREEFGNVQTVAPRNFFEVHQTWIPFNSKFVELVKFISDPALFCGMFLRPTAPLAELAQAFLESD